MASKLRALAPFLVLLIVIACLELISVAQVQDTPRETQQTEGRDLERRRQEWFYGQRAYPHKHIPAGARLRALRELDRKMAAERQASSPGYLLAPSINASWSFIGPQPIDTPYTYPVVSGRVTALAVDPRNSNTVYLGAAQGGVWKTIDGGTSWTPLTDTEPSLALGSVTLDPSNPNTVYVGTGEENFSGDSYYGAGILKSTDAGATWSHICGPFCGPFTPDSGGAQIGGLAVDPANNQILLASVQSVQDGVYRSTDAGNMWTNVLSGNPGTAVVFDPTNGNIAYAALYANGVYKSTNGGLTWTAINGTGTNNLPLTHAGRIALAIAPSSPTTLYAGIQNATGSSLLGLFKTTDGGSNWTKLTSTPDYCNPQCWYDHVIAVQPTNANVIYAGGAAGTTLVRSLDGGNTWTILQSASRGGVLHADMHALAFSPDGSKLYLGNDGGAYSTTQITDTSPTFTALNSTLGISQFYPGLSIHPSNPAISIGGTQDNGTVLYNGALTWNQVTCGDGGYTAIDFAIPSTMYRACQNIDIQKSPSGGAFGTWGVGDIGIDYSDRHDFIPPLVMDPSQSNTLYFGTYRVYQTTDGASSWMVISPSLTSFSAIATIAVAPSDSNTVYAGTLDSEVQVTTNAGAKASAMWINRSTGLPFRSITNIAVDPLFSTTAYVTFSGFTGFGDNLGHVFRSTNAGSTWTDISGDLPNTPVNWLVVDPAVPGQLFVATDVGVFYTTNEGVNWFTLMSGLPRVAVLGLALDNPARILRASTHGRGVWDINLGSAVATLSAKSFLFGGVLIGDTSAPRTLTLTNTGGAALHISSIIGSGDYMPSNNCPSTLNTGSQCTITIIFKPSTVGFIPGIVTIADDASSPQLVNLSGTGLNAVSLSPTSASFGNVAVGSSSVIKTVTLTNNLSSGISFSFRASATFTATGGTTTPCGSSLVAKGKCTISLTFKPKQNGTLNGNLSVTSASFATQIVSLTGSGTGGSAASLTFNPTSTVFSNELIGTTAAAKTVTLTNSGPTAVNISALTASADFTAVGTSLTPCGGSLAPASKCTFAITFKPSVIGAIKGSVAVANNSTLNPQIYDLSGAGVLPVSFSPSSVTFAGQAIGTTSPPKIVTLNNNRSSALTIASIVASGDFSATPGGATPCGSTLVAKGTCTFQITFAPIAVGTVSGVVTVTHSANGSPQAVKLTGTGQ